MAKGTKNKLKPMLSKTENMMKKKDLAPVAKKFH